MASLATRVTTKSTRRASRITRLNLRSPLRKPLAHHAINNESETLRGRLRGFQRPARPPPHQPTVCRRVEINQTAAAETALALQAGADINHSYMPQLMMDILVTSRRPSRAETGKQVSPFARVCIRGGRQGGGRGRGDEAQARRRVGDDGRNDATAGDQAQARRHRNADREPPCRYGSG